MYHPPSLGHGGRVRADGRRVGAAPGGRFALGKRSSQGRPACGRETTATGMERGRAGPPTKARSGETGHRGAAASGDNPAAPGNSGACASGHIQERECLAAPMDEEANAPDTDQANVATKKGTMLWVDTCDGN